MDRRRWCRDTGKTVTVKPRNTCGYQKQGKILEQNLPQVLQREPTLLTLILDFYLQNCETADFCAWYLVREPQHTSRPALRKLRHLWSA